MIKEKMESKPKKENRFKEKLLQSLEKSEITIDGSKIEFIFAAIPDNRNNMDGENPKELELKVQYSEGLEESGFLKIFNSKEVTEDARNLGQELLNELRSLANNKMVECQGKIVDAGGSLTPHYVMLIAILEEEISEYRELIAFVIQKLVQKVLSLRDFENAQKENISSEYFYGEFEKSWVLLRNYAEDFLRKENLPDVDILTKLSAARYEGSESEARIYFTDHNLQTIETFEEIGKETRIISNENLRMIRKLMEISKRNKVFLYASYNNMRHEVCKLVECIERNKGENENAIPDVYVKFSGFLHWSIMRDEREVLTYYQGKFTINDTKKDTKYKDDIKKLKGIEHRMVEDLVEVLKEQKHGTSVIISDYADEKEDEVERLCKVNRGIKISAELKYDKTLSTENGWNKERLLGITGIDGALFMDMEGRCLAIGVIVDGKATIKGDVGRGARYNSIRNYVEQKEKGIYIGIVVSEDGMINIVKNKYA